jgi:hypothetical protein
MKKQSTALLTSIILCCSPLLMAATQPDADPDPTIAAIDSTAEKGNARQQMKNMTPEQRKAIMTDAKKKWDGLSEADKQAFRNKSKDRVEKIQARLEKRHKEMTENNGEKIYMRLYAIEHSVK